MRLITPCRARRMGRDHNIETAHLEIPADAKHGDPLFCSFPACRDMGVKFLYCCYCKGPIARRSFRNKHYHAELRNGEDPNKVQDRSSSVESSWSNSSSSKSAKKKRGHLGPISTSSEQADEPPLSKRMKLSLCRREAWALLFQSRPSREAKGDETSEWLMQVLTVSDRKTPIPALEKSIKKRRKKVRSYSS